MVMDTVLIIGIRGSMILGIMDMVMATAIGIDLTIMAMGMGMGITTLII